MPDFTTEVEVDAQDWWDEACQDERDEMIEVIREDLGSGVILGSPTNLIHEEFIGSLHKLSVNYYMMTKEEIDLLSSLAKRF
jgi:hypothetical protein